MPICTPLRSASQCTVEIMPLLTSWHDACSRRVVSWELGANVRGADAQGARTCSDVAPARPRPLYLVI